jgi:hypothetical protein
MKALFAAKKRWTDIVLDDWEATDRLVIADIYARQ